MKYDNASSTRTKLHALSPPTALLFFILEGFCELTGLLAKVTTTVLMSLYDSFTIPTLSLALPIKIPEIA